MESNSHDMLRIVSIMSVPRVGWNEHWGCHWAAIQPFGFHNRIGYGCWWDHTMSNLMEDEIGAGADWILTLDYDSMFTVEHVNDMLHRFGQNPHMDALAALQPKRDDGEVLTTFDGSPNVASSGEAVRAATAHFGMTLFRADAIKRMPKPWFLHTPDKDGSYRTLGRIDPDMYFWRKWRECGNTLYVDPFVRIGHLELRVSQLVRGEDGHLRTQHFPVAEWRNAQNKRLDSLVCEVAA